MFRKIIFNYNQLNISYVNTKECGIILNGDQNLYKLILYGHVYISIN